METDFSGETNNQSLVFSPTYPLSTGLFSLQRPQSKNVHAQWIEVMPKQGLYSHEDKWSSSIGVGSAEFVQRVKIDLGIRAQGRKVIGEAGDFELREFSAPYISPFEPENEDIGVNNAIFWNI
jgi:hypothetical protein